MEGFAMSKKALNATQLQSGGPKGIFFVTYIGAAVYFINQASGFLQVLWALIKAMVWPGIVVYHVLQALHV